MTYDPATSPIYTIRGDGKITHHQGGHTIKADGLYIEQGGLTVVDGGVTITDDGLNIVDGGLDVQAGGATIAYSGGTGRSLTVSLLTFCHPFDRESDQHHLLYLPFSPSGH